MKIKRNIGTRLATICIVIGIVAIAAWGVATVTGIPDSAGVFHACFDTSSGAVRLVQDPGKCKVSEQATRWNQAGVDISPQIPIILRGDGTIIRGSGFTAESVSTGTYRLDFPPGTFEPNPDPNQITANHPIMVISPFGLGEIIANLTQMRIKEDGSCIVLINVRDRDGNRRDTTLFITITK